jgi:hypothetical protein
MDQGVNGVIFQKKKKEKRSVDRTHVDGAVLAVVVVA